MNSERNNELYKIILKILDTAIIVVNKEGIVQYFNRAAKKLLQISPEVTDLKSVYSFLDTFTEATRNNLKEIILQLLNNQPPQSLTLGPVEKIEGKRKKVFQTTIKVIRNKKSSLWGILLFFTDISEKKAIEQNILLKTRNLQIKNQIAELLNSSSDLDQIATVIRRGLRLHSFYIALFAKNILKISGTSSILSESTKKMLKLITIDFEDNQNAKIFFRNLKEPETLDKERFFSFVTLESSQSNFRAYQNELLNQLASENWGKHMAVPLINSKGDFIGALVAVKKEGQEYSLDEIGLFKDFTNTICLGIERFLNEHKINKLAYFDELTGLPNLKLFKESVSEKLKMSRDVKLFLVKLRDFSKVVSSRGDIISDQTIVAASQVVKQVIEKYNNAIYSRGPGASFVLCLDNCKEGRVREIVNNIIYMFSKPLSISGNLIQIQISIGIASPDEDDTADTLIQKGNVALEKAKEKAVISSKIKNNYEIFDSKMLVYRKIEEQLEQEIIVALEKKSGFVTHYQPKCDINGIITGYEALVRWKKGDEFVSPGVFIPKINKMGLSDQLFNIVLEQVSRDIVIINKPETSMSINIEPAQFTDPLLIAKLNRTFRKYGVSTDVHTVKLEIIETDLINTKNLQMIKDVHNLGVKISVDDFGSGYSNLKTINELSKLKLIDEIKIDKSLVQGITIDATLINIILEMAKQLNIDIVAEGVETIEQYYVLKKLHPGVIIQGWLFAKAMPVEELAEVSSFEAKLAELTRNEN